MTLLNAGYWQTNYWPANYWNPLYWPKHGTSTPVSPGRLRPEAFGEKPARKLPLSVDVLNLIKKLLELKT